MLLQAMHDIGGIRINPTTIRARRCPPAASPLVCRGIGSLTPITIGGGLSLERPPLLAGRAHGVPPPKRLSSAL
jgi:hypothetical protein